MSYPSEFQSQRPSAGPHRGDALLGAPSVCSALFEFIAITDRLQDFSQPRSLGDGRNLCGSEVRFVVGNLLAHQKIVLTPLHAFLEVQRDLGMSGEEGIERRTQMQDAEAHRRG